MVQASTQEPEPGFVEAKLSYIIDEGFTPVHRISGPGESIKERPGTYAEHPAVIHDGRPTRDEFTLATHGFAFTDHDTRVKDFYDADEVKRVYYPEVEQLVKAHTGAARVLVFDHTLRSGDDGLRAEKQAREPVKAVHNDYTENSGPQRVRDLLPAGEAEACIAGGFAIVQVWRPIRGDVETDPLAICDARSMVAENFIVVERHYPHRIGETYHIAHNPNHRWYYFPRMTRNEALVFKVFDSDRDAAVRFTAHTAFSDPASPPGAPPRESMEARALVFFGGG